MIIYMAIFIILVVIIIIVIILILYDKNNEGSMLVERSILTMRIERKPIFHVNIRCETYKQTRLS